MGWGWILCGSCSPPLHFPDPEGDAQEETLGVSCIASLSEEQLIDLSNSTQVNFR